MLSAPRLDPPPTQASEPGARVELVDQSLDHILDALLPVRQITFQRLMRKMPERWGPSVLTGIRSRYDHTATFISSRPVL